MDLYAGQKSLLVPAWKKAVADSVWGWLWHYQVGSEDLLRMEMSSQNEIKVF